MTTPIQNHWRQASADAGCNDRIIPFPGPCRPLGRHYPDIAYRRIPHLIADALDQNSGSNSVYFLLYFDPERRGRVSLTLRPGLAGEPQMPYDGVDVKEGVRLDMAPVIHLIEAVHLQILRGQEEENPHAFMAHRDGWLSPLSEAAVKSPLPRDIYPLLP